MGRLGGPCQQWAESLLVERGVEGIRVLQGLLGLTKTYTYRELRRACEIAHSYGAYRLRTLRTLLKRREKQKQGEFEFCEEDPIIRSLVEYDRYVADVFEDALERKVEC